MNYLKVQIKNTDQLSFNFSNSQNNITLHQFDNSLDLASFAFFVVGMFSKLGILLYTGLKNNLEILPV